MSTFKTKPTHKFHSILNGNQFWWVAVLFPSKTIALQNVFFPISPWQRLIRQDLGCYLVWTSPPPKKKVVVVVISLSLVAKKKHTCVEQSRERAVCPLATSHHPLCLCCYSLPQIQLLTTKRGTGGRRREEVRIYILLRLLAHRSYQVKVYLISKEEEEEKEKMVVFIDWRRLPGCGRANDVRPIWDYTTTILVFILFLFFPHLDIYKDGPEVEKRY